jgi:hypothetical protein
MSLSWHNSKEDHKKNKVEQIGFQELFNLIRFMKGSYYVILRQ